MATSKAALFAFNGDPMCFVHVLLNAFDLKERGWEVGIVIEGSATRLVKLFADEPTRPFAGLYRKALEQGLVAGVCKACAAKMGSLEAASEQGLNLLADMKGHPSLGRFRDEGWEVYTF